MLVQIQQVRSHAHARHQQKMSGYRAFRNVLYHGLIIGIRWQGTMVGGGVPGARSDELNGQVVARSELEVALCTVTEVSGCLWWEGRRAVSRKICPFTAFPLSTCLSADHTAHNVRLHNHAQPLRRPHPMNQPPPPSTETSTTIPSGIYYTYFLISNFQFPISKW